MDKEFYTVKDVAEMWGLAERTVRELVTGGKLKGRKIANKYLFTAKQLTDCIEQEESE